MRVFVTGASGHLAAAVIPELIAAGHDVLGLARSEAAAATVAGYGARVHRGDLADPESIGGAAAPCDGVIHLAFDHEQLRSGNLPAAVGAERAALDALGDALAGTGKPLVAASGTLGLATAGLGRPGTEHDTGGPSGRSGNENAVIALAERGVRASVVRVPPITHSELDRTGLARTLIAIARRSGVSGYPGDGANRWPAGHTRDVAHLFCLALENAPAGTRWHAAGQEGITMREIAGRIAEHLGIQAVSIPADQVQAHFGPLAMFVALDNPTSTQVTRQVLGWAPTHPDLFADFDTCDYFTAPAPGH
ncbi:SDR family oxidoreductase [Kitasatospora sp. NPDC048296]|uniref:SDR family oxidoreductase n=1 Tax=Kitasatospora sp. NPDC048296 TaxID=3364048 RepID=UPI00370FDB11